MGGLGARRHRSLVPGPGAGGAVAEREDVVVAAGLERLVDHQLIAAVASRPSSAASQGAPLTPAVQTMRSAGISSPARVRTPSAVTSATCSVVRTSIASARSCSAVATCSRSGSAGSTAAPPRSAGSRRRGRDRCRAGRSRPAGARHGAARPRARPRSRRRRRSRSAAAAPAARGLGMAAQEAAEHPLMDPLGLGRAVEVQAVLGHPGHAEVVDRAADRDHQRVVAEAPRRRSRGRSRRPPDRARSPARPIEATHAAELEARNDGRAHGRNSRARRHRHAACRPRPRAAAASRRGSAHSRPA